MYISNLLVESHEGKVLSVGRQSAPLFFLAQYESPCSQLIHFSGNGTLHLENYYKNRNTNIIYTFNYFYNLIKTNIIQNLFKYNCKFKY